MMNAILHVYHGSTYALPLLLNWNVHLTGSVPCDSFSITFPYHDDLSLILDAIWRVSLYHDTAQIVYGIVDETEVTQNENGRFVTINGRGLAALLLDNETAAAEYCVPTLSELLRNHVSPYGIRWSSFSDVRGSLPYTVASGSSQWKVLSHFTQCYAHFAPRFSPNGTLIPSPWRDNGQRLLVNHKTPLLSLTWRDKRYGVYSEILVVDKVRKTTTSVKNDALLSRGGQCRRVLYTPGLSNGTAMRYTGDYQIAQSKKGSRSLTVSLPAAFFTPPGSVVRMERSDVNLTGDFFVEETTWQCDAANEHITLTMRRLNE